VNSKMTFNATIIRPALKIQTALTATTSRAIHFPTIVKNAWRQRAVTGVLGMHNATILLTMDQIHQIMLRKLESGIPILLTVLERPRAHHHKTFCLEKIRMEQHVRIKSTFSGT
jgi:hypothetical protein